MNLEEMQQRAQQLAMTANVTQRALFDRFNKIARHGQFDAILPHPKRGLILVGGPRNKAGKLPAGTRLHLTAALKGAERAFVQQRAFFAEVQAIG